MPNLSGATVPNLLEREQEKSSAVVVAEGIPPVATKLLEKIRRWEFIDLALLISEAGGQRSDDIPSLQDGRVVLIQSVEQAQRRKRQISDINMWTRAFAVYMASLASAVTTTMEQMVGLIAHLHLITQLSKDLSGGRWLRYDRDYREWAAAKGVRKWGELNLTIYGRCLSYQLDPPPAPPLPPSLSPLGQKQGRQGDKRGKLSRNSPRKGACFRWNFEGSCDRLECRFLHSCYYCGDSHRAGDCPLAPKRPRRD